MTNKNSNLPFIQVPKIIHEDPLATNDHQILFAIIYDQLRHQKNWNKTNEWLSVKAKIGLSQLKIKINELEEWGYILRKGYGLNRKFTLGNKMINRPKSNPVQNQNRPETNPISAGNQPLNRPESNLDNKNLFNTLSKISFSSLNHEERKELGHCLKGNFKLAHDYKYLQPLFDALIEIVYEVDIMR